MWENCLHFLHSWILLKTLWLLYIIKLHLKVLRMLMYNRSHTCEIKKQKACIRVVLKIDLQCMDNLIHFGAAYVIFSFHLQHLFYIYSHLTYYVISDLQLFVTFGLLIFSFRPFFICFACVTYKVLRNCIWRPKPIKTNAYHKMRLF